MQVISVSAVTITSPAPERLAEFYRERLGVPLMAATHGPIKQHFEGFPGDPRAGGVHFAILKGRGPDPQAGGAAPSFRVRNLEQWVSRLEASGTAPRHRSADLGEGKRVASFRDPDGNVFRLIDLGF